MGRDITFFGLTVSAWLYVPVIYFVWVTVLLIIKKIFYIWLVKIAEKTENKVDDAFVHASDFPVTLLIFVSGALVIEEIAQFGDEILLMRYLLMGFKALAILALVIFLDRLVKNLIGAYAHKVEALKAARGATQGIVRVIVFAIGFLMLLDNFGISVTPLLASLGIGSLAVALALQPTLENLFAGMQIIADQPIRVGQFVKLDSGEEGYVHKIGLRSTWVRMLPNNVVVVPNKALINSKILNYYYPEQDMAVLVQVGVHYSSDLKHVEKVTIEVGQEVMKTVPGGVPEFKPFIRYHTFNDFSIDFTVILRAKEFVDNYLVKHEFIKRLHERYNKEGIVIPFPIRDVYMKKE